MSNFYTSDSHFNHAKIIEYCNRPFDTVEDMNEGLINAWNTKVPEGATVFHLGDVIFGDREITEKILPRLNGNKILVIGNHDRENHLDKYFVNVYRLIDISDEYIKRKITMCHYPIESWNNMRRGTIHLHGHCHGTLKTTIPNRMDVGVDCHSKFAPFSSKEILRKLNAQNE